MSKCVEHPVTGASSPESKPKPAPEHTSSPEKSPVDSKGATFSFTDSSPDFKKSTLSTDHPPKESEVADLSPEHPSSTTDHTSSTADPTSSAESDLSVEVFAPWDIQSIQDGLGGRYDRDTIVDMLQKCRGNIDRAFAALLGENTDGPGEKKLGPGPNIKPSLQVSRSSSPFSTGSKRSADDSDDSEDPRPPVRRVRPKRHIVSNLTFGVGISFCDDQNEVVSLNLQVCVSTQSLGFH